MTINEITSVPKIDLTITISVIVALCAIISPVLTAIINNIHQTKIKKMEIRQQEYKDTFMHERDIFESYLKYAGRCIYHADADALKDYGKYYFPALMLASPDLRPDMIKANELMLSDEWTKATAIFEALSPKIRASLQTQ